MVEILSLREEGQSFSGHLQGEDRAQLWGEEMNQTSVPETLETLYSQLFNIMFVEY